MPANLGRSNDAKRVAVLGPETLDQLAAASRRLSQRTTPAQPGRAERVVALELDYSPDGTKIASRSGPGDDAEIYTVNADGTGFTRLTSNAFMDYACVCVRVRSRLTQGDLEKELVEDLARVGGQLLMVQPPSTAFKRSSRALWHNRILESESSGGTDMQWSTPSSVRSAVLLVAGCGLLAVGAASALADREAAPGGRIAFASNRDGDSEIYVMKPDGSALQRLTHSPKVDSPCQWSRDGRRLLFYSQRSAAGGVWVMNANGSGQRSLTSSPAHNSCGTWSPDGKQIVFDSDRDGRNQIYVMHADGTSVRRLTTDAANDDSPAWSPDGKTIAFVSDRDGGKLEIFVMAADGSNQRSLTQGPNGETPVWSPDGERIAYVGGTRKTPTIQVMNADGSSSRAVVRDTTYIGGLSWSPDGHKLSFASGRDQKAGELYVVNVSGSGLKRLTRNRFGDNAPVWSR